MSKLCNSIIISLCLLLPGLSLAATTDFVAGSDVTVADVTYGETTASLTIVSGANAASWKHDGGTFTVTNPGSGATAFKITCSSSAVYGLKVSNSSGTAVACEKNNTPGTSYVTVPSAAGTYTIAPVSTNLSNSTLYNNSCGSVACSSGYSVSGTGATATCVAPAGGGGGSPGSVSFSNSSIPRAQTIYPDGTIVYHDEETTAGTVAIAEQQETTIAPTLAVPSAFVFTKILKKRMENDEVKKLQEFLASDPSIYPEGLATGYYGTLTEKAVRRFQVKHGIVSSGTPESTGYGLVGPSTRAKLNEIFGGGGTVAVSMPTAAPAVSAEISAAFSVGMGLGMSNSNIKRLQQLLNSDSDTAVALSGVGSAGQETEYYGSLTGEAVQKFQMKYGVVNSASDVGYGYVGPKTRAKLNEIFGSVTPAAPAESSSNAPIPATPADTSALEAQIQSMIEQVQLLQTQLNAL